MDANIQNNNNTNANRKMIKFLWFFKNFADFSWPLLILVFERNEVASTVIFVINYCTINFDFFFIFKKLIHLEHYRNWSNLVDTTQDHVNISLYFPFTLFLVSLVFFLQRRIENYNFIFNVSRKITKLRITSVKTERPSIRMIKSILTAKKRETFLNFIFLFLFFPSTHFFLVYFMLLVS
jgi:hypothetical protein